MIKDSEEPGPSPAAVSQQLAHKPILLLVNTGSQKKRFILQRLAKLNLFLVVLNAEKNWADLYVDDWIMANTGNHSESLRAVKDYVRQHPERRPDGILTFWEDDVLLTSKLTDEFKTTGIPFEVSRLARNKFKFRQFCAANGLPYPKHTFLNSVEPKIAIKGLKFPLVVKPTYGSSSAYVVKVDDLAGLEDVVHYLRKSVSVQVESALGDGLGIFCEEYIDGDEVDIDLVIQNGKVKFWSMSDNYQTNEPFFVETGQQIPSILPEQDQQDLVDLAEVTLEKLGVINGVIHFEAKMTKKGPVPIEVNLRMGGDEVHSFVKSAWHVDLIDQAVNIALGRYVPKLEKPEEPYACLAGKYFLPEESGILVNLDLPEKKNIPAQGELHFFKQVGDPVYAPPEGYDFLGWVTAKGENANDARDNLDRVYDAVEFEVVPFEPGSSVGQTSRSSPFAAATLRKQQFPGQARLAKLRHTPIKKQRQLHIGIASNEFDGIGGVEAELTQVGHEIQRTLAERGYRVTLFDFNNISQAFNELQKSQVDLVFNVAERINNSSLLESHSAALLDILQIPYTGSNPTTLALCIDKIRVKKLLDYHNIPTPKWDYAYTIDDSIDDELQYPLIVKPANTDNSIGVTNDSVVTNKKQLRRQIKFVIEKLQRPALVEEYIEGDEYDVSILGSEPDDVRVLPLSRSRFDKLPKGYWHIFPFEAKRYGEPGYKDSVYKKSIKVERPPKIPSKLAALISEIGLDTYNILDCHDYARVEVRVDSDGNPYVLEMNPNPSIGIGDCVPSVAEIAGQDYGDFLEEIIALAIKRYRNRPPYYHLQPSVL